MATLLTSEPEDFGPLDPDADWIDRAGVYEPLQVLQNFKCTYDNLKREITERAPSFSLELKCLADFKKRMMERAAAIREALIETGEGNSAAVSAGADRIVGRILHS